MVITAAWIHSLGSCKVPGSVCMCEREGGGCYINKILNVPPKEKSRCIKSDDLSGQGNKGEVMLNNTLNLAMQKFIV